VVWVDDYVYWDFCAQREPRDIPGTAASAPATKALFNWLADTSARSRPGRIERVEAEIVERQGPLIIRYSKPIQAAAKVFTTKLPAITELVQKCNGDEIPTDPTYTINFLAGGGGGWAGPYAAGVCVYGGDFPIRVMGHELTHSIANPLPGIFGEAWAIKVGQKVGSALGGRKAAWDEYREIIRRLDSVDPKRNKLDIMESEHGPWNQDHCDKAVWMLSEFERKYGQDFMARVLQLRGEKYGVRKPVTLAQLLDLFVEASRDKGIYGWYRSLGINLNTELKRHPTSAPEVPRR
jgi:hypothetical protein